MSGFQQVRGSTERSEDRTRPTVLITGAAGVIAQAIRPLLERSFGIRLTDLRESFDSGCEYRRADLLDFSQVLSLMDEVDAVVHMAIASDRWSGRDAEPPAGRLSPYEDQMIEVNLRGTANLFEAAKRAGIKKIVYLSSLTVYFGDRSQARYSESDLVNPQNFYACTKLFGENLARVYAREHGISLTCLRVGQPYPSGLKSHDAFWKTNKRSRSTYVAMEDIAFAVERALVSPILFGVYNIVSASDNPRFDISAAKEIGYFPRACFTSNGLEFSGSGIFPRSDAQVATQ